MQSDPITATGEIGEGALIVRVDPSGAALTERAAGDAAGGADREMDGSVLTPQAVNPYAGEGGERRGR